MSGVVCVQKMLIHSTNLHLKCLFINRNNLIYLHTRSKFDFYVLKLSENIHLRNERFKIYVTHCHLKIIIFFKYVSNKKKIDKQINSSFSEMLYCHDFELGGKRVFRSPLK